MTTDFEVSDKELKEIYNLLTKEELIEVIIKKYREYSSLIKNCNLPTNLSITNNGRYEN